jgi:hypothetical protein
MSKSDKIDGYLDLTPLHSVSRGRDFTRRLGKGICTKYLGSSPVVAGGAEPLFTSFTSTIFAESHIVSAQMIGSSSILAVGGSFRCGFFDVREMTRTR